MAQTEQKKEEEEEEEKETSTKFVNLDLCWLPINAPAINSQSHVELFSNQD
jgi:hypothetical protein